MSDILPHSRSDLVELPCDVEPLRHDCGCTPYLCPTCNPRRSLLRAQLEVSLQRLQPSAEIISLAQMRVAMRAKR